MSDQDEKRIDAGEYELSSDPTRQEKHLEDSISTASSNDIGGEKRNYVPEDASLSESTSDRHCVNVKRAEANFNQLNRELSNYSQIHQTLSRTTSKRNDVEKVVTAFSEREPFNLEEVLRGNQQLEAESGIKSKHIGVVWDGLTVSGGSATKHTIETFLDASIALLNVPGMIMQWFSLGRKGPEVDILKDFRGVMKPGEMCLVLGSPGSGCTTFLKVIANQRFGYSGIKGEVMYGPFDSHIWAKKYRNAAIYSQEDDIHSATLTVGQTLDFAVKLKTPGKRPAGMSKTEFRTKVVDLLLRMFNIEHTRDTMVGGPFVRGVSGGERKRVSIAESMVCASSIQCYDQSTRGLDSSTALDWAKSMRIVTNIYKTTTFSSLYQASENIYKQFDKVLVIDKGRQTYFGPTTEARAYFEGLGMKPKPRQTTADYLVAMTDEYEREYQDGYGPHNAPHDTESFVAAFENSDHARRLDKEMSAYHEDVKIQQQAHNDFIQAHQEDKRRGAPKSSPYTASTALQIGFVMQRQFILKWQDKFSLCVSYATALLIAVLLGTTWLQLPLDSPSAFTRGGLLFISLLFNALAAFAELGTVIYGRALVNKHKAWSLYRPSSLWLAQIFVDTAFAAVQILVFSLIVYFSCGLALAPGAFFTFFLMILTGYLTMTVFFRTVGCLCPSFDLALRAAVVIITLFVTTAGYLIQWSKEQVWLRWIFYVNGLGLGLSSLMINEFSRINFNCTGSSLIPSGPGYDDINHQVCALAGSRPGTAIVTGTDYVYETFDYAPNDLWRNWGIMVVLVIVFLGFNIVAGEKIVWGEGGRTLTFFAKENKQTKVLNEELSTRRQNRREKKANKDSELLIESKAVLTWENLCYEVPVGQGNRRLLNNVFGYCKPGTLTALMGQSGAGKTTLLDVLANRKNIGVISGDILVDATGVTSSFARSTSYAEQLDVHEPTATVREALRFSADLRQPYHVPQSEKYAYVEEIISLLEMEDIADAIIGSPESGLAVEQRKRVTIGVELSAKPELLLFLDEPTSGLDSVSAFNIVRFLRKLCAAGQAIICTVHQPNSALFESFDLLYLLQAGGEVVYAGPIGADAKHVREYFSRYGAEFSSDANVAEAMLDVIGAGLTPRVGDEDWGQIYQRSPEFARLKQEIIRLKEERLKATGSQEPVVHKEYASPLLHQFNVVFKRTNLSFWRSPNYCLTRLFNHAALALLAGLVYLQLDDSLTSLQTRVFAIFQITVLPALIISQVQPRWDMSRLVFYRESAAKSYGQFSFAVTQILAEMPYSLMCAVVFFLPLNYIPNLQSAPDRAGYQFLMILAVELFSVTLGQMISALTPNTNIAVRLNAPVIITFSLYCGITIPRISMPAFWRWLYYLDPFTHLASGSIVTELHGRMVECKPNEYNRFTPPSGQTCGDYMARFFSSGNYGYIQDPNSTSQCSYCAYKTGDEFYERLGLTFDDRWQELGYLTCYVASNIIIIFVASRYLNFNRR